MVPSPLTAISPIDGRYSSATQPLASYFSESALIRYRLWIEVEYFIALCDYPLPELAAFPKKQFDTLRQLYIQWENDSAKRVKEIEKTTNHDVKAVEYYLKDKLEELGLSTYKEFVHFGLTSQDINNTAIPLLVKHFLEEKLIPRLVGLLAVFDAQVCSWKAIPMLARTHGQPASPTRLGKEIEVFAVRVKNQLSSMEQIPHCAKFGGAVGNFNAHHAAYPHIDWGAFGNWFIHHTLQLTRSQPTTQIEHYDNLAALCDNMKRINTILIDYSRDMWQYIAMDYFKQKIATHETGSSTMPHKINPIDFENAEGNLGIANALLEHLSAKLPISRLQRDLTDSTVIRNIGMPFAHMYVALNALEKGIGKLIVNREAIDRDLQENWGTVAEAIQTVLRRVNYPNPYEALKTLTRKNKRVTKEEIHDFIHSLKVEPNVKKDLLAITPFNYTGI